MNELDRTTPPLFLLSGIMAAGKSTVAQALAERFPKSVHLRGDIFRRMIVRGQAEMTTDLSPEAVRQLELRYRLAVSTALQYIEAGFPVIYQDIVVGHQLPQVVTALEHSPLYVVVLCPSAEVAEARAAARQKGGYTPEFTPHAFDSALRRDTPRIGLWLDSSSLTETETVDAVLARLDRARVR